MSRMRQKRKARGEAARAAAEALAEQAGDALEITEESAEDGEGGEAGEVSPDDAADEATDAGARARAEAAADDAGAGEEGEPVEGDAETEDGEEAEAAHPLTIEPEKLRSLVEALLFASDKPLSIARLRQLTRTKDAALLQSIVDALQAEYTDRGMVLQEVSGGFLFRTHHAYSQWVQQLVQGRPVRLSRAQLETLALVAYRQPITKPEIDQIRGVDSGGTLKVLLDRTLVRILGKKEEPGRPLLYGTTREFLDFFSLKDLRELPTLREYSELTEENKRMVDEMSEEEEDESSSASDEPAA